MSAPEGVIGGYRESVRGVLVEQLNPEQEGSVDLAALRTAEAIIKAKNRLANLGRTVLSSELLEFDVLHPDGTEETQKYILVTGQKPYRPKDPTLWAS